MPASTVPHQRSAHRRSMEHRSSRVYLRSRLPTKWERSGSSAAALNPLLRRSSVTALCCTRTQQPYVRNALGQAARSSAERLAQRPSSGRKERVRAPLHDGAALHGDGARRRRPRGGGGSGGRCAGGEALDPARRRRRPGLLRPRLQEQAHALADDRRARRWRHPTEQLLRDGRLLVRTACSPPRAAASG